MKTLKTLLVAVVAIAATAFTASAGSPLRFGPRVGTEINSLRFGDNAADMFKADNRAGFTGGLELEFTAPVINLGFDLSVMYVHRVNKADAATTDAQSLTYNKDYIEVPLNLKYKLGLPVVGNVFTPYIFTGPSFAFLTSKKAISEAYNSKTFDVAWNFGVGVQLFSHFQVGASYGLGLTKALEKVSSFEGKTIDGKNKYWTVTAAWLF